MPASKVTARAPGRLNLIGEHTDYNDGLALAFAIDRAVYVTAEPLGRREVEAHALDLGQSDRFFLDGGTPASGWRAFVRGAVGELHAAGFELSGARLVITGTVPHGSGLSSSAAMAVALCLSLLAVAGYTSFDRLDLARLCSRVETHWVGAQTGLLDQLTILFAPPEAALLIDFRSTRLVAVPLPLEGWRLVCKGSGAAHNHASSGYNTRRRECFEAAQALGLSSLRDARVEDVSRLASPLDRRAYHVVCENRRVEEAARALAQGDLETVGALLNESHRSLRESFEVSVPALDRLVEQLRLAGATGARMIGGGFGGYAVGLFPPGVDIPDGGFAVTPAPAAGLV